jgi:hypothetical protein
LPKIEHKPIIPAANRKKNEEVVTKKKKIIEDDDDDNETFEEDIPSMKKSRNLIQQVFSDGNSFDSYSEEAFEEISFARKEKKVPHHYERMSAVSKPSLHSLFPAQAMPPQKIITNEIPELIKSSPQMTIELLHAVQLIFNDREEVPNQVIEIHQPNPNPFKINL